MQLHLKEIEISESVIKGDNAIWGIIYFQSGDFCFPDDKWYDISSAVLQMWTEDIIELINNGLEERTMYFMDGPFSFTVLRLKKSDEVLMIFKANEEEIHREKVALKELIEMVQAGVSKFLELCDGLETRRNFDFLRDNGTVLLSYLRDRGTV